MNTLWSFMERADTLMFKAIIIGVVGVIIIQAVHCGNKDCKEDKIMVETELKYWWPEVFDTKDLAGRPDAVLCADGLTAWGNSMAGAELHPNFGEVMAKLALKLDILGTPESFMEKAKEYKGE
jgi:hypothetical protein